MSRKRRPSRKKRIKPHFWVFCEGETEEAYVHYLRSKYRLPIEIEAKVSGSKINKGYIARYKKGKPTHEKDRDFLIYDADVEKILKRLNKIDSATLLTSNPSIELWFLLHYKNQTTKITEYKCIQELCNRNKNRYKKGIIDKKLKEKLESKQVKAIERAKKLTEFENPSSNMYIFIELLKETKKQI